MSQTLDHANSWSKTDAIQPSQIRFLRMICLFSVAIQLVISLNITLILLLILNKFVPAPIIMGCVSSLIFFGIYKLASKKHYYYLASWLVISSHILTVATGYVQTGTALPLMIGFMLPIGLAIALLLRVSHVVIITALCVSFTFAIYLAQNILGIYQPTAYLSPAAQAYGSIFLVVIMIPATVALMLIPIRGQAQILQTQNNQLSLALQEIKIRNESNEQVSAKILELAAELRITATQQVSKSEGQAAVIAEINQAVHELSNTAVGIAQLADHVDSVANLVTQSNEQIKVTTDLSVEQSDQGLQAATRTVTSTQQVAGLYQQLVEMLNELKIRSGRVQAILEFLEQITDETHLLSLNASIEAAGADDVSGNRFGVVAQEMKSLAARSSKANREVVQIVEQVGLAVDKAVSSAKYGYKEANSMETTALEACKVIETMRDISQQSQHQAGSIGQAAHQASQLTQAIKNSTAQQQVASEQVLTALKEVNTVAQQNVLGINLVSLAALNLEQLTLELRQATSSYELAR